MPVGNWSVGRTDQTYWKDETTYGVPGTLAATDAIRENKLSLMYNPKALRDSPQRAQHPSILAKLVSRSVASFDIGGLMYPSGTLNTVPELDLGLKRALGGTPSNVTLSTTLSGTPTTTGGTVASATGLAVGQFIQITTGGVVYARFLTAVAGTALTWAPALPAAPASSDVVKGGLTYGLATNLPKSIEIVSYPQSPSAWYVREQLGCVPNQLVLTFDGSTEPQWEISGPALGYKASPQSQPGGFTLVGAEGSIPSGLTGAFLVGGTSHQIEKLTITLDNGMDVQNTALGTNVPSGYFRKSRRKVSVQVDEKVSDDLTLWTPSLAATSTGIFCQIGLTSGFIWAVYIPSVYWDLPDTPDADETRQWSYKGSAVGSLGNDEIYIGQL